MSLYALSVLYDIISANIASIKMKWFNNDKTHDILYNYIYIYIYIIIYG